MVNEMADNCMREQKAVQKINAHVNGILACPLRSYLKSVDDASIHWYKVKDTTNLSRNKQITSTCDIFGDLLL